MKLKCVHAVVHGRVQGVFFRDYTRQEAEKIALGGWVRNLPDRTVETVFQGAPDDVDRFLAWLHIGSPMAEVTSVDSREEVESAGYDTFEIRY
jgi:acylphosphatase